METEWVAEELGKNGQILKEIQEITVTTVTKDLIQDLIFKDLIHVQDGGDQILETDIIDSDPKLQQDKIQRETYLETIVKNL